MNFSDLTAGSFDAAIIGGGIIGAGIARDLTMRGLSVALVDQADFGSGTTSGSTRLVHGGLRYLEMLDFGLVRMDLRERETLLRIAPHLVKPLEFRIPFVDHSFVFRQKMRAGLLLYDLLSYDKTLPNHRFMGAAAALEDEPGLRRSGLRGAASFYDAQVEQPERLCLENLLDAASNGAVVRNYTQVTGAATEGERVTGLHIRDEDTGGEGLLRAKVFVNATHAWFDRVVRTLTGVPSRRIRTTKGIHLVCGEMVRKANVLFSPLDGRLFFVIPLLGKTWIGTTDTDYQGDPADVRADEKDVEYLLRSVEPFFPDVRRLPIYSTNAGVRALVPQPGSESSVSRMHRIEETPSGVISVLGGKITGYRAIAEDAADAVCRKLGHAATCRTAAEVLPPRSRQGSTGAADVKHWAAESARTEFARHLDDFLIRRAPFAFREDFGVAVAEEALRGMAEELAWDAHRRGAEWERFRSTAIRSRAEQLPAVAPPVRP